MPPKKRAKKAEGDRDAEDDQDAGDDRTSVQPSNPTKRKPAAKKMDDDDSSGASSSEDSQDDDYLSDETDDGSNIEMDSESEELIIQMGQNAVEETQITDSEPGL